VISILIKIIVIFILAQIVQPNEERCIWCLRRQCQDPALLKEFH